MEFAASDLAEWWDKQHRDSDKILDRFVEENPGIFGVILATAVATSMDVGAGFVDVLRLGEGAAEGGWGYGKDLLRFVAIMGPLGRGGRLVSAKLAQVRFLQLAPRINYRPICTWVASTQALRLTGVRHFVAINDLLRWSGLPTLEQGFQSAVYLRDIIGALRVYGARISRLANPSTMADIEAATVANSRGVVLFSVRFGNVGHTMVAFRNSLGQFQILDRSGKLVSTLAELNSDYNGIGSAVPYDEMYFMAEALVVQVANGLSVLALEVNSLLLVNKDKADEEISRLKTRERQERETQGYTRE